MKVHWIIVIGVLLLIASVIVLKLTIGTGKGSEGVAKIEETQADPSEIEEPKEKIEEYEERRKKEGGKNKEEEKKKKFFMPGIESRDSLKELVRKEEEKERVRDRYSGDQEGLGGNKTGGEKKGVDRVPLGYPGDEGNGNQRVSNRGKEGGTEQIGRKRDLPGDQGRKGGSKTIKETDEGKGKAKASSPFATLGGGTIVEKNGMSAKKKDMYQAKIYGDQKIPRNGAAKFRNEEPMVVDGRIIPANSILYGKAKYSGNRVHVTINRIKTREFGELPVKMEVLDNDYISGIFFKDARDEAVDESGDDAVDESGSALGQYGEVVEDVVQNTSKAIKRNKKLSVEDGYTVFVKPIKK